MQELSKAVWIVLYKFHNLLYSLELRQGEKFNLAYNQGKDGKAQNHREYKKSRALSCPSLPKACEQKI